MIRTARDLRVHKDHRRRVSLFPFRINDEYAAAYPNLRCRKTTPGRSIHRLEHIAYKRGEHSVKVMNRRRHLQQNRIPFKPQRKNSQPSAPRHFALQLLHLARDHLPFKRLKVINEQLAVQMVDLMLHTGRP